MLPDTQEMDDDTGGGKTLLHVCYIYAGVQVRMITLCYCRQNTGLRHVTASIATGAT